MKFGLGGLHSDDPETHFADIEGADFGSYYPHLFLRPGCKPGHLKPESLGDVYQTIIEDRLKAKAEGDKTTADALKLIINSTFGLTGDCFSSLYFPPVIPKHHRRRTTPFDCYGGSSSTGRDGGPMQILSMNTDGLFYKCESPEESERVRKAITEFAAEIQCPIDFTKITEHRQEHINSYIQVIANEDGSREVKGKGAWNPDPGINADHNATVVAKAMSQHLLDGTDIREFIESAASEKRFLEFTSMQSSRASTIRVGGEPVGGMIRVLSLHHPRG